MDDGSSDGSYEHICSRLGKDKDEVVKGIVDNVPVVLLRNEKPTGPSAARNRLIKYCMEQADIFAMLDADDEMVEGKISQAVVKFIHDPLRIGLVYTDHIIKNEEKQTLIYEAREPYDRNRLERENIISNAPIISKRALQTVGLYDENLRTCEDWDLYLRITEHFVAIHIPKPLQLYRVTGVNATHTVDTSVWQRNWQMVQYKLQQRKNVS